MSIENRKAPRRNVQHPSVLLDHTGAVVCLCTMKDVSATGAKLELAGAVEKIPDAFILRLSKYGAVHRECLVSWRSEAMIGVQFVVGDKKRGH